MSRSVKQLAPVPHQPITINSLRIWVYALPERADKNTFSGKNSVFICSYDTAVQQI